MAEARPAHGCADSLSHVRAPSPHCKHAAPGASLTAACGAQALPAKMARFLCRGQAACHGPA
eukprot:5269200-Lingulodinium_polyedra.AAC.1